MYSSMSLTDYVAAWMKTFKSGSVKPATYARLETSLTTVQSYTISRMQIKDITAFDIQQYVNELTQHGYGLTTIKKQLQLVTAPLKQAAAMHFIASDPSIGVRLPSADKVKKPSKQIAPYTEQEQQRLWEQIDSATEPGVLAVGIMLETGMRIGEVMALKWSCVDIQRKRLKVEATILNPTDKKKSTYQNSPKTISSKRMIPLTPKAIEVLTKLKALYPESEWVFPDSKGSYIGYKTICNLTKQTCKNANIEYRGEHVFRHTFATNCYYRNVDVKVLSKILGHSNVNITYNIYISLRGDGFDEMYLALTSAN